MKEQSSARWGSASAAFLRLVVLLLVFSMSIDAKLFSSASGLRENAEAIRQARVSFRTRPRSGSNPIQNKSQPRFPGGRGKKLG